MPSKPLPKPVSARTLQKKYIQLAETTRGRIDIATDSGSRIFSLLHRYFAAFSNLYGVIPLRTAWKLFCEVESDDKPLHRMIINKKLISRGYYRFHDFCVLMDSQSDKPYALLTKEEYRAWADPDHFRKSFCARDMLRFLENLRVSNDSKNLDVDGHPIHGKTLNKFIFWNSAMTGSCMITLPSNGKRKLLPTKNPRWFAAMRRSTGGSFVLIVIF